MRSDVIENPFLNPATESAEARARMGSEPTIVMIRSSDASTSDLECTDTDTVEITVLWGTTVLLAKHLSPTTPFRIGEASTKEAPIDFVMPADVVGASAFEIVRVENGVPYLELPRGARTNSADLAERGRLALLRGTHATVEVGAFSIKVAMVAAGKRTERGLAARFDRGLFGSFGATAMASAALMAAAAFFTPSLGLTADEGIDKDRLYAIQQYLDSSAEREREREAREQSESGQENLGPKENSAEAAKGASGTMGKPTAEKSSNRAAWRGPKDNPRPEIPREVALAEARAFGIIGILNAGNQNDPNQATAIWGADVAQGADAISAIGNMWGDDIGDSYGVNGLTLSGLDEGGGGRATVIGLDGIGTCQGDLCRGGMARSFARPGGPDHHTRVPRIRPAGNTDVSGRLPPETVQRVVRQSYGRFRSCYEGALRTNPNLEGRVTARFVISREGSVSNVSNGGSDLPDSGAVSCVLQAFYGLSFPTPEGGGIVTVVYPIMFSPGS